MRIETDLTVIAKLAREKDDENWEFRSFLKGYAGPDKKIDRIVQDLYREISARIDCQQCGNCCRVTETTLRKKDIDEFVLGLKLDAKSFEERYLAKGAEDVDEDDDKPFSTWRFKALPCPFLGGNLCLNYEHRPQECRSYPHLHKAEFTHRLIGVVSNYAICPLVFNVYEQLKEKVWRKRR